MSYSSIVYTPLADTLASSDWSEIKYYVFHSVFFYVLTVRVIKLDDNNNDYDNHRLLCSQQPVCRCRDRLMHIACHVRARQTECARAADSPVGSSTDAAEENRAKTHPYSVGFFLLGFFLVPPPPPPIPPPLRNTLCWQAKILIRFCHQRIYKWYNILLLLFVNRDNLFFSLYFLLDEW